mgnify:CR=1 FL=1
MEFPAGASEILEEYKGTRKYKKAETAVLYCSDAVVSAILLLLQKEPEKKRAPRTGTGKAAPAKTAARKSKAAARPGHKPKTDQA